MAPARRSCHGVVIALDDSSTPKKWQLIDVLGASQTQDGILNQKVCQWNAVLKVCRKPRRERKVWRQTLGQIWLEIWRLKSAGPSKSPALFFMVIATKCHSESISTYVPKSGAPKKKVHRPKVVTVRSVTLMLTCPAITWTFPFLWKFDSLQPTLCRFLMALVAYSWCSMKNIRTVRSPFTVSSVRRIA